MKVIFKKKQKTNNIHSLNVMVFFSDEKKHISSRFRVACSERRPVSLCATTASYLVIKRKEWVQYEGPIIHSFLKSEPTKVRTSQSWCGSNVAFVLPWKRNLRPLLLKGPDLILFCFTETRPVSNLMIASKNSGYWREKGEKREQNKHTVRGIMSVGKLLKLQPSEHIQMFLILLR